MYPHELHLIQVDNAQAHSAQTLTVPNNIILLFQSPYCREINPIERVARTQTMATVAAL
jgi:transposase